MTWEPQHVLVGMTVLSAPLLLTTIIAIVRGYNVMVWKRNRDDDPVFYFGRRRLSDERRDDDD